MEQSAHDKSCDPFDAKLGFVEFARTNLTPEALSYLGFDGAEEPKADCEPQNSDIRLFKDDWRYGALRFVRALEAANHNPNLRSFAHHLRKAEKPHNVITIADAKKLLTIANALFKRQQQWAATAS